MLELVLVLVGIGFVFGYFADRFLFTNWIAKFLDGIFRPCNHKD